MRLAERGFHSEHLLTFVPAKDIARLFGVQLQGRSLEDDPELIIKQHDPTTYVHIFHLDRPQQARRWAGLEVFKARHASGTTLLAVEVDGLGAYREWECGKRSPKFHAEALPANSGRALIEDRALILNDMLNPPDELEPEEHFAQMGKKIDEHLRTSAREALQPTQDATRFTVCGGELPTLAETLANHYAAMVYREDDDPRATVARALGVGSLELLAETWNRAMIQPTALAAGQFALAAFNAHPLEG